jgi:predicted ATPase
MKRSNCYVITGGVGFGKTTLIEELCKDEKYFKIPEIKHSSL